MVENDRFHATIGDMAHSAFLNPNLDKLLGARDEAVVVRLVLEHRALSRWNMEMFIAPKSLTSEAVGQLSSEPPARKQRGKSARR